MQAIDLSQRIVRYGDLVPCRTAFIDAHTPGSDQKENFTIIGGGVAQAPGLLEQIQQEAHRQLGGYLSRYDELDSLISLVQRPRLGSHSGLHGAFLLAQQAARAET